MAVAESEAISDRRRAVSASDEVNSTQADLQGAPTRRPSNGRTKKVAPAPARMTNGTGAGAGRRPSGCGKAISGQDLLATRQHVVDKGPRQGGLPSVLQDRHRVASWYV